MIIQHCAFKKNNNNKKNNLWSVTNLPLVFPHPAIVYAAKVIVTRHLNTTESTESQSLNKNYFSFTNSTCLLPQFSPITVECIFCLFLNGLNLYGHPICSDLSAHFVQVTHQLYWRGSSQLLFIHGFFFHIFPRCLYGRTWILADG